MFAREHKESISFFETKDLIQQDCEKRFEKIFGKTINLSKCESELLKTFQKDLGHIEAFILPKESNPFVTDLKEIKQGVDKFTSYLDKDKQDGETNKKIDNVYQAFQSIDTIGKLTKNQDIQRAAQIGMASVQLFAAAGQLIAAGASLNALGPMGTIAACVLTLATLIGKKKKNQPDPFATAVMQNFQIISEQIKNMHIEMRASFEHVSRQIGTMHMEMRESFGHLSHQITAMHMDMRDLFNINFELFSKNFENQRIIYQAICDVYHVVCEGFKYLEKSLNGLHENHKEVMTALDRLEATLSRSTLVLGEKIDGVLLQPLRNLLNDANNLCEDRYEYDVPAHIERTAIECVNWLKLNDGKSSTDSANGAIYLPRRISISDHPRIINEILSNISEDTTKTYFGFLTQYAMYYLRINLLKQKESKNITGIQVMQPVDSVFNPMLWSLVVDKYIELKIKFPHLVKDKDDRDFNLIVAAGHNQLMITSALRSFELFDKLFRNYQAIIDTELMHLIQEEFSRINAKMYAEKVCFKGVRSTPNFDLKNNLLTIINTWSDAKPVSINIEGENIGFKEDLITNYNHPTLASPLLVLAERLGVIYFHRLLRWQHTKKNSGDIRGTISVNVALKYSKQSKRIPVQTNSYDTSAARDPDTNGNYILDHWKTMGGRDPIHHAISIDEMIKIKQMILRVFLDYRAEIFSNLLKQATFKEILQKLEASRNLLIHYSIAASFKPDDIAILKKDIWGAREIIHHFVNYINNIKMSSENEEKLSGLPLPMTDMPNVGAVSRNILTKLRDDKSDHFENDALGNIQSKMSMLKLLKFSNTQASLEKKSEEKSIEEKARMEVIDTTNLKKGLDRIIIYYSFLEEDVKKINETERRISALATASLASIKSSIDKLNSLISENGLINIKPHIALLKDLTHALNDLNLILKRVKSFKYESGAEVQQVITHLNEIVEELTHAEKTASKQDSAPSAQIRFSLFSQVESKEDKTKLSEHKKNFDIAKRALDSFIQEQTNSLEEKHRGTLLSGTLPKTLLDLKNFLRARDNKPCLTKIEELEKKMHDAAVGLNIRAIR